MAVPKVCGIETEYGVVLRGAADPNPVLASSVLINGYVEHHKVGWDFEDESPGVDARGERRAGAQPPEIETHLVNTVLTNGARYYVDHAHPEYSTPECSDALELVLADKAGERVLARSMLAARSLIEPGQEVVVYKNNSDGKGNSYGTHENYLVDRALPFATLVRHLLPWFVTRQVFTGAGKVGSENGAAPVDYQISSRADFFEEEVGLETTLKRPIVNTRDEPHADPQLYRRLHVIAGDANLCEVATFLKVGTTAIVLAMVEDDFFENAGGRKDFSVSGPVAAMRVVSHDPTCKATVELADGSRMTAVELQWEYLRLAQKYADETGLAMCGGPDVGGAVLGRWESVLTALEHDPSTLDGQLDWVTKLSLLGAYVGRDGLAWSDPKLALLDLQYSDVRPDRSLYERLVRAGKIERLLDEADVMSATTDPPETTRAYFRGGCLARWPDAVVAANWDSIILDVGSDPLKRIPMMEPLRGSREHVEELFATVSTPAELVARLST
ncbi:MAG: proteasome accessory factor PafA2 [Acidimicrobiia bacterium]|nr:proteasome accessory factor PafA2 [Acidimicrobiia bacterium]